MNIFLRTLALASLALPFAAHAHKAWLLPSATVLPVNDWVTVDAGISNDLFVANHNPLKLDNLVITAPDGSIVAAENTHLGKFRSSFDLKLAQVGTYRLAIVNNGLNASWEANGETKRWRGTAETFAKEVPADAAKLQVSESSNRVETFVTDGARSTGALKTSGNGLELVALTHPNDLFVGEPARFKLLLDGKPAAMTEVDYTLGGTRYRNQQNEQSVKTDTEGNFSITWSAAGAYLLTASVEDDKAKTSPATKRRAGYSVTLEVLPQ